MKRTTDASLKHLNSFAVEARAGQLLEIESQQDLKTLVTEHHFDPTRDLILGGGSNILFAGNIEGSVILNRVSGKRIIEDSEDVKFCWRPQQGKTGTNLFCGPGNRACRVLKTYP